MVRSLAFLLTFAGLAVAARQACSEPSDSVKPRDKAEASSDLRELIPGKWRLVDPEVKLTLQFSRDGAFKLTTSHFLVNGKPVALMKDGKPVEDASLDGSYRFTSDGKVEGEVESPVPDSKSKTWKFQVKPVSVSDDRLTLPGQHAFVPFLHTVDYTDDGSGKVTTYERVR